MASIVLIIAITMGFITLITLVSIRLGTSYSLKKHGYNPNQAKETYNQLRSNLERVSEDLKELRADVVELIIMTHDRPTKRPGNHW